MADDVELLAPHAAVRGLGGLDEFLEREIGQQGIGRMEFGAGEVFPQGGGAVGWDAGGIGDPDLDAVHLLAGGMGVAMDADIQVRLFDGAEFAARLKGHLDILVPRHQDGVSPFPQNGADASGQQQIHFLFHRAAILGAMVFPAMSGVEHDGLDGAPRDGLGAENGVEEVLEVGLLKIELPLLVDDFVAEVDLVAVQRALNAVGGEQQLLSVAVGEGERLLLGGDFAGDGTVVEERDFGKAEVFARTHGDVVDDRMLRLGGLRRARRQAAQKQRQQDGEQSNGAAEDGRGSRQGHFSWDDEVEAPGRARRVPDGHFSWDDGAGTSTMA